jgi:glycogen operon protein
VLSKKLKSGTGFPSPLGASLKDGGVNFAVYSRYAGEIALLLFDHRLDTYPTRIFTLYPKTNRTGDVWHIHIEGISAGQFYGFKVKGPRDVKLGHRYNSTKTLLDPYAKAISAVPQAPKSVIVDGQFDWEGIAKPHIPWNETIIYEAHLRGLTIHPSSGVICPGTYRGVTEKIPYLQDLGITALELLPVHEFNHWENLRENPRTGAKLGNYWGYSTIGFFAPKGSYCSRGDTGEQVREFKEMVRELHRAGIEVILDVVYNHSAEMNHLGPYYHFRGFDNRAYYLLEKDKRYYRNMTGCGNTLFCNHFAAGSLILDSLRYWATEMGVDGFRFDLATIFNRDRNGDWWENPPILHYINNDPVLKELKLISEPWDASGGYKMGSFGGVAWRDWNDRFRDDVRRFWKGDNWSIGGFATRLAGSADYFSGKDSPLKSVNFITCHDGFTLNDLMSYNYKHNIDNCHRNHDGAGENFSQNFGVEGETDDIVVNRLRLRQAKNFFATLLLSQGIPMILGGDECLRTQKGNNNAYCQDNEVSWFNWDFLKKNSEVYRFVREMIKFRRRHPALRRDRFFRGEDFDKNGFKDVIWFCHDGTFQDWKSENRTLAVYIDGEALETGYSTNDDNFYIMFNSLKVAVNFIISPPVNGNRWRLAIDTAQNPPWDICSQGEGPAIGEFNIYRVSPLSMVVLVSG